MPMSPRLLRPRAAGNPFLLDGPGAGAFAAYGLRRLSSSYTGAAVRIRRSSDSAESDFTSEQITNGGLVAWVGAGNNGLVTTWYDQSGNSRHASNSTAADQPRLVDNGSLVTDGGFPAILANQRLRAAIGHATGNRCVIAVATHSNTGAGVNNLFRAGNDGNVMWFRRESGETLNIFGNGAASNLFANYWTLNARLLATAICRHSAGDYSVFRNGSLFATATGTGGVSPNASDYVLLGGLSGEPWVGRVSELVYYTTDISSRRSAIEANINQHFRVF